MFYSNTKSAVVRATVTASVKPVAPVTPAVDYRAIVNDLYTDSAEFFADEPPSLEDIFYGFDRLVEVVAQLDGPANWVSNG
jgi:hypothetical protein